MEGEIMLDDAVWYEVMDGIGWNGMRLDLMKCGYERRA